MAILKKAFFVLLVVGIIISSYLGYLHFKKIKTPQPNAIVAIPANAFLIIESHKAIDTWKKIANSNLIWKDLIETKTFNNLHNRLLYIDSTLNTQTQFKAAFKNHTVYISFHESKNNTIGFLGSISIPFQISESDLKEYLISTNTPATINSLNYEGTSITILEPANNSPKIYFAFHKHILLFSANIVLIEKSIQQLNTNNSLLNNKSFMAVKNTAGNKPDGAIYINYNYLSPFVSKYSNENTTSLIRNFAGWTQLDLNIKSNEILFSGYSTSSDSITNFLSVYKGQQPCEINATTILPQNTLNFIFSGITNQKLYRDNLLAYYNSKQKKQNQKQWADDFNRLYDCDVEELFTTWINNEIVVFTTANSEYDDLQHMAAFGCTETESTLNNLLLLSEKINNINEKKTDTMHYEGHLIINFPANNLLLNIWGSHFKNITSTYVTAIDNYIVVGNNYESLKSIIINYKSGRTLENDEHYNNFFESHLDTETNLYYYSTIGNTISRHIDNLTNTQAIFLNEFYPALKKIHAAGIQFSNYNELIYTTAFINHNPVSKQLTSTLWEVALDTTVSSSPQSVVNHNTKTKEIVVQDDANNFYLITSTGKILWKKKLSEKIIGSISQIDALNNNKLQFLFNTKSEIHLIDRNGNNVKNFPVKLTAEASAPLTVIDYDNNKAYRILIPCINNTIYNYNAEGEQVNGWKKPKTKETIHVQLLHFNSNKMDFITAISKSGNILCFNRHGEPRLSPKTKLINTTGVYTIITGKTPDKTCIISYDTVEQCINKLYFNEQQEKIKTENTAGWSYFNCKDLNNDKSTEYILANDNKIAVLNNDEGLLFEHLFSEKIKAHVYLSNLFQNNYLAGVLSAESEEIFLFKANGELFKGFPLKGQTGFFADDLNKDGALILICGGAGNNLFAYQIE